MGIFLQIISTGLTFISAKFFLQAAFIAPERFAEDFFDLNSQQLNNRVRRFSNQRASELVGFCLLLLAFIGQIWDVVTPQTFADFEVGTLDIFLAIVLLLIIYFLANKIRNKLVGNSWEKIRTILGKHAIAIDHWKFE